MLHGGRDVKVWLDTLQHAWEAEITTTSTFLAQAQAISKAAVQLVTTMISLKGLRIVLDSVHVAAKRRANSAHSADDLLTLKQTSPLPGHDAETAAAAASAASSAMTDLANAVLRDVLSDHQHNQLYSCSAAVNVSRIELQRALVSLCRGAPFEGSLTGFPRSSRDEMQIQLVQEWHSFCAPIGVGVAHSNNGHVCLQLLDNTA
jgi:hypothetical protein